ncbi:MAG: phosphotransferase [Candidatus Peribacteria bacterium]|nr:phosphotransferase [Candidatus Peribacteria bacterium]
MHSLPATPPNFVDYLVQQGTSYYYQNQDNPFLSSKQLEKIYLAFTKGISSFHQLQETVIHNDFRYKNILVEQGNLSGVIDFETAVQGPLCIEFFQLLFTHYYAKQEDDADEQDFMEQFLQVLPTLYPELCQYTDEQFRCFCLFRYLGKLVKFREPWYRHTEVEQFAKEFL